jgi:hypothetical protein
MWSYLILAFVVWWLTVRQTRQRLVNTQSIFHEQTKSQLFFHHLGKSIKLTLPNYVLNGHYELYAEWEITVNDVKTDGRLNLNYTYFDGKTYVIGLPIKAEDIGVDQIRISMNSVPYDNTRTKLFAKGEKIDLLSILGQEEKLNGLD